MSTFRLNMNKFTEYRDQSGIPYRKFDQPDICWHIPKLFTLHESLIDDTIHLESVNLWHPKVEGYKLSGAYRIFDSVTGEQFYIGRSSSSSHRGVLDRITDFRTGVLAGVGQFYVQSNPYENGLRFGKKYGKRFSSNLSAEFVVVGAGESKVLTRKSSNLEARWLREHYEKYGRLPEFNTRMENELPDLPWGSRILSEVNPLEQFLSVA